MNPKEVAVDRHPASTLHNLLREIHREGPSSQEILERISLYKELHPDDFAQIEEHIVASMGLFYKLNEESSLYSFLMRQMGEANRTKEGVVLTPVQASVRNAIEENRYVSISAPTSAGKSYSIRDFISSSKGDAVIVVPSRALIAEYVGELRRHFRAEKGVMVMPFVDKVFTSRDLRRIFVLTPERAREIFERAADLDVRVFFFDEAQVSDEEGRGIIFDVLVRRVGARFPSAKLIFAHPFVENPEAQFKKHRIPTEGSYARSYTQGAVGKIFVFRHSNSKDYYFSPFNAGGHLLANCMEFSGGFANFALQREKSVLVYVTKGSLYSGTFLQDFREHIEGLPELRDPAPLRVIQKIESLLGSDQATHKSEMVRLLKRGVVIHHGSVPLEVRFLIEDFIRGGFARVCFATSTLAQGINMPFDVVWLNSLRLNSGDSSGRSLAFKNLIGRAGRLSGTSAFDYGYVFTKDARAVSEKISEEFSLSETSVLEAGEDDVSEDDFELIEAIRNDEFDDELHMPNTRLQRLDSPDVRTAMVVVLDLLYENDSGVISNMRGREAAQDRDQLKVAFKLIYEAYLGRSLNEGEDSIFDEAMFVMVQTFAGRTFREIVGMRFSKISQRDSRTEILARFSQKASALPDSKLSSSFPLFPFETRKQAVSYDVVVFDTYDYLDQVVAFCLSDTFSAAARIYYRATKDLRALRFVELMRFGTNDMMQVLLMRYGFLPENLERLRPYVLKISEEEIEFAPLIESADADIKEMVQWYR